MFYVHYNDVCTNNVNTRNAQLIVVGKLCHYINIFHQNRAFISSLWHKVRPNITLFYVHFTVTTVSTDSDSDSVLLNL